MDNTKRHIDKKAAVWTAITMGVLTVLLMVFGFSAATLEEESGMLINFGNTEDASGAVEPAQASPPVKTTPPPPPPPQVEKSSPSPEDINTQDFEEAAAIEAAKKKEEKIKQEKIEQELEKQREIERQKEVERQKEIEAERIRQEEIARLEQERLAKEAKAEAIRQQTNNAFGKTNNNSQSQGNSVGTGNQGAENGSTTSNGNGLGTSGNWSLAGRSMNESLPIPKLDVQKEGTVVVEISVDRNGRVTSANPILKGSTTQDAQLWKLAQEAAKRAKFNADPTAQIKQLGTITYKFILD